MLKSMTGYGRAQQLTGGKDITVEIKSVNHRFFEFSSKCPRAYGFLEDRLKRYLQKVISRGKVDLNLVVLTIEGSNAEVEVNIELLSSYVSALRKAGGQIGIKDDLTLSTVTRFTDIFNVRKAADDEEETWELIKPVVDEAVEKFVQMREQEGKKLKDDIIARLDNIASLVKIVEQRSPQTVEEYRQRLYAKMCEVLNDANIDQQRILTEAAIYADKVAVDEETVRLKSHISQFKAILEHDEPVGRKLDFLVQEVNREANTIGSKAQDIEIARIVVDIKADIEKIREQIQNIE
ncbi:MAG TPA: YicC family protein [Ruminococcaceae bacterium]|nr:YicC family protein [Oscillospiraceae bacterium]